MSCVISSLVVITYVYICVYVFILVGNIPHDATEVELTDIFSKVGPVVKFTIVYHHETGKPKGYGFCEYRDADTAQSAIRNLNNTDFHGRPLRVSSKTASMSLILSHTHTYTHTFKHVSVCFVLALLQYIYMPI